MNTFLPYPDFHRSAQCLDRMRLGKQRVEVLQLLKALVQGQKCLYNEETRKCIYSPFHPSLPFMHPSRNTPWYNHPCTQMWVGHELALAEYGMIICKEWISRGFKDTCFDKIRVIALRLGASIAIPPMPSWLGNDNFHSRHRSNLLRKYPEWYGRFGWKEQNDMPYYWPLAIPEAV